MSKKKNTKPRKCQDQIRREVVPMYEVLQREIQLPKIPSVNQPKSCFESSKSSASPLVKVCLAVTVFLVIMAIVVLTVLIIILFLKVSALEAAESNSSGLQKTKQYKNTVVHLIILTPRLILLNENLPTLRHKPFSSFQIILNKISQFGKTDYMMRSHFSITLYRHELNIVSLIHVILNTIHDLCFNKTREFLFKFNQN